MERGVKGMRCIVIDVGNTSTGIGLYDGEKVLRATHLKGGILKRPGACAEAVRKAARAASAARPSARL